MEIQIWQIIALTILSMILIWDSLSTAIFDGKPMFAGILAGIIMGDIATGLAVGATLQLMVLGVGTYGGSSMPDYLTGAIVGTVFAVTSGQGVEFGIGLAVPVGLLMVNLDVLARFCNVFFCKESRGGDRQTGLCRDQEKYLVRHDPVGTFQSASGIHYADLRRGYSQCDRQLHA